MDFVRSTSIEMNLWPVEHFCPPISADLEKNGGTKVFNWSEVHFSHLAWADFKIKIE